MKRITTMVDHLSSGALLIDVDGVTVDVGNRLPVSRGILSSARSMDDMHTLADAGAWALSGAATYAGAPAPGLQGTFRVDYGRDRYGVSQTISAEGRLFWRELIDSTLTTGKWSPWVEAAKDITVIADNTHHIDDFVTPGMKWYVRYDATADPVRGYPAGSYAGYGEVFDRGGPLNLLQVYYSRASAPAWRSRYNGAWGPWTSFAGGPLSPPGVELTPAYDSGVRNVTQTFLSAFTTETNYASLMRSANTVEFSLYARKFDKAGTSFGTVLFTLPVGWRPRATYRTPATFPAGAQFTVHSNGTVTSHGADIAINTVVSFNFTHLTADSPPAVSSLPGTN